LLKEKIYIHRINMINNKPQNMLAILKRHRARYERKQ
jgi:hypothetical protein